MTVQLHAFTCGHLTIPTAFLLADREGSTKVPITSYPITPGRLMVSSDSFR